MDLTAVDVAVVMFFATLVRSTFGFGEAMIAVPLLALRIPLAQATPLAVMTSVLVAGIVVVQDWHHVQVRSAAWLLGASLLGIPVGLWLLTRADPRAVKVLLGVVIAGFSLYSLAFKRRLHLERDRRAWMLGAGFCAGVFGGAYGMNGPPLVVYGALRRWSPQHFRATLQGYFLPASLLGLLGYAATGLWVWAVTRYFLLSLPGVLLAVVIGRALNRRLRGDGFFRIVYAGLMVIGTVLIVQAVRGR